MPLERHIRLQTPYTPALNLPPPFRLVTLREVGDAFAYARTHAAELGAGTLISVGRFDLAEFAVVFEPDDSLASAWRALYAGMVALADALATIAPPEKSITIEWPDAIRVDGGLVGGGRLAWPDGADEAAPPPWLVFGAMIRTVSMAGDDSGVRPLATALEDEGFRDVGSDRLVESFARHLMRVIDRWREAGFAAIADNYVSRLERGEGVRHDIGDNGELLVRGIGNPVERRRLKPKLAVPSWLDPHVGGRRG
jgi:biotin-(acetyl-CoA carboxylase) ligase